MRETTNAQLILMGAASSVANTPVERLKSRRSRLPKAAEVREMPKPQREMTSADYMRHLGAAGL